MPQQNPYPNSWFSRLLPGGIRPRLFLLVALMVLPLMGLLGWISWERYQLRIYNALQTETEVAVGVATTFAAYVEGMHRQCKSLGEAITTLSVSNRAGIRKLLTMGSDHSPTIRNLSWVDPDGTVLVSSAPGFEGRSLSARPYFREIAAGKECAIGDLTSSGAIVNKPTVAIAVAIKNGNGRLSGVIVAAIEPPRMGELTLVQHRPEGGAIAIFDSKGVLVYHSVIRNLSWEQRVAWKETDPVLRNVLVTRQPGASIMDLDIAGGRRVAARVPISGIGWVAGAGTPADVALVPLRRGLIEDIVIFIVVSAGAFVLAYLLGKTIVEPLRRVEANAEAMGAGEPVAESDPAAPTEILKLRHTLARLAAEQTQRAEALRQSEQSLRAIFDNVYDGIIIHSEEGNILDYNHRYLEIYKLSPQEAETLTVFDISAIVFSREALYQLWADVMKGESKFFQWRALRPSENSPFDVEIFMRRVTFNGRNAIMANIRDITERKKVEEELQRAKEELEARVQERTRELEQAFRELQHESRQRVAAVEDLREKERLLLQQNRMAAMGEMIGNIAHQWRQPLNTIGLLIQELSITYELGDFSKQYLQESSAKAMQVLHHMSRTIDDFRNFFKPDKGKVSFRINSVVAATVSLIEASLKAYEIAIDVVERDELFVDGFPSEFSQAILNILTNARDVLQERDVDNPHIRVELLCENDRRIVTISDNGGGIREEIMDRIFEPYFTTKGHDKGTGIGLFMAKTIIEKNMGGRLTARNDEEGAQFRIEI